MVATRGAYEKESDFQIVRCQLFFLAWGACAKTYVHSMFEEIKTGRVTDCLANFKCVILAVLALLKVVARKAWIFHSLAEITTLECIISNTRKGVSSDIQTLRSGLKNEVQPSFLNPLQSVWISDETLFQVFDIASQSIDNCYREIHSKISQN